MKAYHNNENFKQQILAQNQKHVELDHLIQGRGWNPESQKGCFIGCSINEYDHIKAYKILGMPVWLIQLCDHIHEGLTKKDTAKFFLKFFKNVKTGTTEKEFEKIKIQFLYYLLTDILPKKHQQKKETKNVIDALEKIINDKKVSSATWRSLRSADSYIDVFTVDGIIAGTIANVVDIIADITTKMTAYKKMSEKLCELVRDVK